MLVGAFNGIDKVDKMVLPLPYCQLLKLFLFCWVRQTLIHPDPHLAAR